MFDVLSRGFKNARLKLQGKRLLTEADVTDALREVRTSLIQADVEFGVVKDFVQRVKDRALGSIVTLKTSDGQTATPATTSSPPATTSSLASWALSMPRSISTALPPSS